MLSKSKTKTVFRKLLSVVQNSHDGSALGSDLTGVTMDTEMTLRNVGVRISYDN